MTPEAFSARVVGTPFVDGGRDWGALDCWGCVALYYRECMGIDLPSYGDTSAHDLRRVAVEMRRGDGWPWVVAEHPRAGDVAIMRSGHGGRAVVHVGVLTDRDHVLHTEAATGAVVVPVTHYSIAHRIAGYRRHAA